MTHTDNANELAKLIVETWGLNNALEVCDKLLVAQKTGAGLAEMGLPPMIN